MKEKNITYYTKLKENSDKLCDKLDLYRFLKNANDEEIIRNNFYHIVLRIYYSILYNTKNKFTKEELNFIIDFEIYKHIKDIINIIMEMPQTQFHKI